MLPSQAAWALVRILVLLLTGRVALGPVSIPPSSHELVVKVKLVPFKMLHTGSVKACCYSGCCCSHHWVGEVAQVSSRSRLLLSFRSRSADAPCSLLAPRAARALVARRSEDRGPGAWPALASEPRPSGLAGPGARPGSPSAGHQLRRVWAEAEPRGRARAGDTPRPPRMAGALPAATILVFHELRHASLLLK